VASPETYEPGALAIIRTVPREPSGLAAVPADSVGGFVYTGGLLPFSDIRTRGVRYVGPVGAEIQGRLRGKEADATLVLGAELQPGLASGPFAPSRPASPQPPTFFSKHRPNSIYDPRRATIC
jgi:hypothetical protein